ncbi:MAG: exosortase B [Roseateles depolymerans]|uniref:Exosortase B n=1 Tax=Roseateles depolymerans TaxID=76731 RepID=A0A2W5D6N5_9BURK|nr:MAG: exosortase B [Roseateles depolymerans]
MTNPGRQDLVATLLAEARTPLGLLVLGWLALFGPTYYSLATTVWASDEQGHGPIIMAVSIWLLWRRRELLINLGSNVGRPVWGGVVFALGWLVYLIGRSQFIGFAEAGAQLLVLAGLVIFFKGFRGLNVIKFPLFFMLFMIPLPPDLVGAVTGPLKAAVSAVASQALYSLGYPVARSGVILSVGQYQLLVADACAGLNSMFTLEALGLLYMNIVNHVGFARNMALAVLIVPISFIANIVRVMVLVLVTYHFGDAAGQGFMHGFAGMVLFLVALVLILSVDKVLDIAFRRWEARS